MAEDQDQKTEHPTPKRLEEAHSRGDVARSQELKHWFMLLGIAGAIGVFGAPATHGIGTAMVPFLSDAHRMDVDSGHLMAIARNVCGALAAAVALPVLALVVVALAGGLVQHRPVLAWAKLKPEFSRISPLAGFKRMASAQALVEYGKGFAKVGIVAAVLGALIWPERMRLESFIGLDPVSLMQITRHFALKLTMATLIVMAAVGAADFLVQRFQFMKRLRMSRQDIRDEMKQSDGDPLIKARIRQLRIERSRRRMMAAVPQATVVVANPTHYAVALRYEADEMAAPRCVAKGVDLLALRIRKVAEENGVPVVENPPLARALHASVEVDREIPPEHYRAVAKVIGYVLQLKQRSPAQARRAARPRPTAAPQP